MTPEARRRLRLRGQADAVEAAFRRVQPARPDVDWRRINIIISRLAVGADQQRRDDLGWLLDLLEALDTGARV